MKIADLDQETRAVMAVAHIVAGNPTEANIARLKEVVQRFDDKHAEEREANLLRALWGPGGIMSRGGCE